MGWISEGKTNLLGQWDERGAALTINTQEAAGHCNKTNHCICDGEKKKGIALNAEENEGVWWLAAIQN